MPVTVPSYGIGNGYTSDASQHSTGGAVAPEEKLEKGEKQEKKEYWPLERCRKAYTDYLDNKQEEISEQKNARRYYHGSQHTDEMIKALNKRKQPVVTFNHIAPKVNGVSGLIERLKQDPKAYPRTPKHGEGADLATAVIRAVLDIGNWDYKAPRVAIDAAVEGYSGIVIELGDPDDKGNREIKFEPIDVDNFFYDPRSNRIDFSDARYMGEGKWLDVEQAQELYPDKADEIEAISGDNSTDLTSNPDRENKFFSMLGNRRLIRVVDCWYKHKGRWCWTLFTGAMILESGESYLFNEKKDKHGNLETICRYIMFSCNVDHDSDRYGFVRNMRSAQDELNARRSRALFTANSRRLIMTQGSVSDIERVRAEWARPDGVIVTNARTPEEGIKADDQSFDFAGQLKLMQDARDELNNYGPNQALIGDLSNQSGRAIQLLQQAGMAELGPYILGYKGWKVRTYRALFNAAQMHWTGEKWIRVTDSQDLAQHVLLNGVETDPMTGYEQKVNAIGELDVDIIMSEGQDTINAQQDVYETLSNIMPSIAPMLKPAEAAAAVSILVESSSLSEAAKKTWREATKQQPDPAQEMAKKITLEGEAAKVEETKSKVQLNYAKAQSEGMPQGQAPGKFELPPELQIAKAAADIGKTQADTQHKQAQAYKAKTDADLAPQWAVHDAMMERAQFAQDAHDTRVDRAVDLHNSEQDRKSRMAAHNRSGGNA
jgi:hypothetical protein